MAAPREMLRPDHRWSALTIAGLGMGAIWLFLAGIVGAIKVAGEEDEAVAAGIQPDSSGLVLDDVGDPTAPGPLPTVAGTDPGTGSGTGQPLDASGTPVPSPTGGTDPSGTSGGAGGGSGGSGAGSSAPATTRASGGGAAPSTAGDRTGVSDTTIKIGIHAPESIGGAPLNLAEDPIKGIEGYVDFINQSGGINGRMLQLDIQDDRYETSGGADAARRLIENDNFVISGTLGVDQINVVANEAAKAGIPYHAAGGGEDDFARLGVYQIGTSYDTHVVQLARFLAQDETYVGKKVGVSALNSGLIKPSVELFLAEARRVGVEVVEVVYIEKPTQQSSYSAEIQRLKDAGTEVFVPLQDPVSTSRMVSECLTSLCDWRYTFSNFAHEGDTALTLFAGEWGRQRVRGLAAACYYLHENAYDPSRCARMDKAHEQWVAVYGEADWEEDGQGGSSGYQIVSMLAEALRRAGPDLTRERYAAAIRTYDAYSDLITSPITFAGRQRFSHGSDDMVVYEAQPDDTYRQITPGFVRF